jgi:hypothetical protein
MEMRKCRFHILLLLCAVLVAPIIRAQETKQPGKGVLFFYRLSDRIDRYLMHGVDPEYIALPEHSWRLALTSGTRGINTNFTSSLPDFPMNITLISHTSPSMELGFNAGYRNFGFGYSWDVLNAYATNLNLSLGGKGYGLEFSRQVSTNIDGQVSLNNKLVDTFEKGNIWITTMNVSGWYALNAKHYNHNAAIKQSYIQRRSAGSLLLSLSYMSSEFSVHDTTYIGGYPMFSLFTSRVTHMTTHQAAVGLGYGINYTPNNGKVLFHLSANMQVVFYTINQISIALVDSVHLPAEPHFDIRPKQPVHVTGNMRAAVSYEINEWVHLSAWGQASHLAFVSKENNIANINLRNWNWEAHLTIGVRFGAGRERVHKALGYDQLTTLATAALPTPEPVVKLPKWITDFFFSPR